MGYSGEHIYIYMLMMVLVSRSRVSRRVGKCWLEVKGRRKVISALTSVASSAPGTLEVISSHSCLLSHDGPFTRVRWYPTPYLYISYTTHNFKQESLNHHSRYLSSSVSGSFKSTSQWSTPNIYVHVHVRCTVDTCS